MTDTKKPAPEALLIDDTCTAAGVLFAPAGSIPEIMSLWEKCAAECIAARGAELMEYCLPDGRTA